ncbi:MAG: hypothetical protein ACH34V_09140 [Flavobacterium sp.]|uniref:hypothetical protein n=1 Tax=Flavobacterium sp. TaxID=239 RepID=UPI0037AE5C40
MPVPIIIGGAIVGAGLAGLFLGHKVDRELFGEIVEPSISDITNTYKMQLKLLEYSLSDGFLDKKIYAYYLYSLIMGNQELLIRLEKDMTSGSYIEYLKNTSKEWESIVTAIQADVADTLKRYLCYETFFKNIFGISYNEKDLDKIREKITPFDYLTENQLNDLILYIINPLFNGWFDFTAENINVLKCSKINILNSEKNVCSSMVIAKFPLPQLETDPANKLWPNHNEAYFDSIKPWLLATVIINHKHLSKKWMDSWMGAVDKTVERFTGVKAGYVLKAGEKAEEIKNTAADWSNKMKKEFDALRKSLFDAYNNTTSGFESFLDALKIAAVAGGGLLLVNLLSGDRNE